jgi:hypothetical protein
VFKKFSSIVFLFISILLICWAGFTTYCNVAYYYAYPLHKEYEYFLESVRAVAKKLEKGQSVHVITARLPYLGQDSWADEYGMPSTYWPNDAFSYTVLLLEELHANVRYEDLLSGKLFTAGSVKIILWPEKLAQHLVKPDSIIIDMNNIRD